MEGNGYVHECASYRFVMRGLEEKEVGSKCKQWLSLTDYPGLLLSWTEAAHGLVVMPVDFHTGNCVRVISGVMSLSSTAALLWT